jgi:hypothetical protein
MNRISSQTLFAGLSALLLAACSDDEDRRPAGTSGSAGNAGNGGTSGATNNGGTSGGTGGSVPSGPPPCTGCVEISMPVSAAGIIAMFNFNFGTMLQDMSNARVTWRLRTLSVNDQLQVLPFAQNNDVVAYAGVYQPEFAFSAANGFSETDENAWVDVTLDLASVPPFGGAPADAGADASAVGDAGSTDAGDAGDAAPPVPSLFDKSLIFQTGLQFLATPAFTGLDTLHVLIDSVDFEGVPDDAAGPLRDRDFSAGLEEFALNPFNPLGTVVTGPIHHPE